MRVLADGQMRVLVKWSTCAGRFCILKTGHVWLYLICQPTLFKKRFGYYLKTLPILFCFNIFRALELPA